MMKPMDGWLISCRTCQKSCGEFLTLDSVMQPQGRLVEVFNNCTRLSAAIGDRLPQLICQECVEKLKIVEAFLSKAHDTDIFLRRRVNELCPERCTELKKGTAQALLNSNLKSSICESYMDDPELRNYEDLKETKDESELDNSVCSKADMLDDDNIRNKEESKEVLDEDALEFYDDESTTGQSYEDAQSVSSDQNVETEEYVEIERLEAPKIMVQKVTRQPNTNTLTLSKFSSNQLTLKKLEQEKQHKEQEPVSVEKQKNFKCSNCVKCFSTTQKLQQHNLVHSKARNFECNICGKRFTTIYHYRDHLKTHSNEREFSCEYCDKSFVTRANLKMHTLSHNAERPYECEVCGKCFQLKLTLKTHMTLHTGKKIECHICHRKFSRVGQLNVHSRIHMGDRPYKCPHCSNAYLQKSHLERHMAVHLPTYIRYHCPHCPRTYMKKTSLNVHLQQEHVRCKQYNCGICGWIYDKPKRCYYHIKKHAPSSSSGPITSERKQINNPYC